MPTVKMCPPDTSAAVGFDSNQFDVRKNRAVGARYVGGSSGINGWESNGISYENYASMHTQTRNSGGRRRNAPLWAMNDDWTRRVVLAYMERRAFGDQSRVALKDDRREHIINVMAALKNRATALTVVNDRLCAEYVACQDSARRKVLQTAISGYDRAIQLCSRPDVFYSVVVDYYRLRLNSVGVAERNGMSPSGVRQLLQRMNMLALSLGHVVECSERARVEVAEREANCIARAARRKQPAKAKQPAKCPRVPLVHIELRRERAGLCKRCGRQKDTGYKRCRACRDKDAARADRRECAGLCGHCGGQGEPGRKHCRACLDRAKSRTARRKLRREQAGLCKRCGGQRDTEYKKCRACLDSANVARRQSN
jgi:hypothetical protein